METLDKYDRYMDQEDPPVPVVECVSEFDDSPSYEVDMSAIFRTEDNRFVGVVLSGCS